jgi:hypothetical protein
MSDPVTNQPEKPQKIEVDSAEYEKLQKELDMLRKTKMKAVREARKVEQNTPSLTSPELLVAPTALPAQPHDHTHTDNNHQQCTTCGRSSGKHLLRTYDKFCPEGNCGEPNPFFKDETVCPSCKSHLGSVEGVKKLPLCPHCGFRGKVDLIKK